MEKSVLDSPNYEPQYVSPWPTAFKYGLIGAFATIILTMGSYLLGFMDPAAQMEGGFNMGKIVKSMSIAVIGYILYTMIYFLAIKSYRDQLGGFITFGKGFKVAFFSVLFKALFVTIFLFIFYQFIASDFLPNMLETMEEMLSESGQSDDQLEMTMSIYNFMYRPFFFALMTGIGTIFGGALLSLLAAAIGQKEATA